MPEQIDVFGLLDQQLEQDQLSLQRSFELGSTELNKPILYKKKSLQRQYDIKADLLGQQYLTNKEYADKLSGLNEQLLLGSAKIEDTQAQERDELSAAHQQELLKIQQRYSTNKIRMQQIQDLITKGHLSPEVGTQQQLGIIGIDVPLSMFKKQTPEERFGELGTLEKQIESELETHWIPPKRGWFGKETPLQYSPTGEISVTATGTYAEESKLREPTEEEKSYYQDLVNRLEWIRAEKLGTTEQIQPERAVVERRARRLTDIAKKQTTTFRSEIEKAKPKGITPISTAINLYRIHQLSKKLPQSGQTVTTEMARTLLQEVGGDKEKARELARSRGYKF